MRLVYCTLAWVGGICCGRLLWEQGLIGCATPAWIGGALAIVYLLFLLLIYRRPAAAYLFLLWPLLLGAWRYQLHPLAACATPADLSYYNGADRQTAWATVEGWVAGYPDVRDTGTQYRLRVDRLTLAGQTRAVQGDLLVLAPRRPVWRYGDRLRVTGALKAPPVFDDFDYRAYLAQHGLHSRLRASQVAWLAGGQGSPVLAQLYALRQRASAVFGQSLPEPAAALANGMLLGVESGIPPGLDEAFKATGTTHILVISGSNIALFSGYLFLFLCRIVGRRKAPPLAVAAIVLYVLLIGGDTSAVRAGIMGGLYLLAGMFGRLSTPLVLLAAAALAMTAVDPLALYDAGFQLSVLATLGLMLLAPAWQARYAGFCRRHLPPGGAQTAAGLAGEALLVTAAAQVFTLPLSAYYFGRLSPLSLLANLLILPVQPLILLGGLAALVAGLVWPLLGQLVAALPWLFLTYTAQAVRLVAGLPLAAAAGRPWSGVTVGVYYAVLLGGLGLRPLARAGYVRLPARRAMVWALAAALPLAAALGALASRPDGRLHLYFLPGQGGEAVLVVTPGGQRLFAWDGRGDGVALAARVAEWLPGWSGEVDLALGAEAAQLWPEARHLDPARLAAGQTVQLDGTVTLVRLGPGQSWTLELQYGRFRTYLPGLPGPVEPGQLVAPGAVEPLTLLKAPGVGTGAWPSPEFLAATRPQIILWPQGTTYPPAATAALEAQGALPVDPDTVVEAITDGNRFWLRQWHGAGRR